MSFDQSFLVELVEALAQAKLQVVFIGNAAAILQGVPVMTQDVDLMIRDHPQLQKKLQEFAEIFNVKLTRPYEPVSQVIRASGRSIEIDFVLALSSRKSFESVRSRARKIRIGQRVVWVASLDDIIAAKEAADRPKDKATLQFLKDALLVQKAMAKEKRKNTH
ncbi:nucleotidyltransferase [bacterium]|nr:nucleotidyltransferase [bacterium]